MSARRAPPHSPYMESPCPEFCGVHSGDQNHPWSFNRDLQIVNSWPGVRELKGAERDARRSCTPGAGATGQGKGAQAMSTPTLEVGKLKLDSVGQQQEKLPISGAEPSGTRSRFPLHPCLPCKSHLEASVTP